MKRIKASADQVINSLLLLPSERGVSILDSCGVGHLGSHLLIAGADPVDVICLSADDASETLSKFQKALGRGRAAIFSISYDLGKKLEKVGPLRRDEHVEPDIYVALYDALLAHDYDSRMTFVTGEEYRFEELDFENDFAEIKDGNGALAAEHKSNFTQSEYFQAIETIKEHIRRGDTYQTNLTQNIQVQLNPELSPQTIFRRLRSDHPAPFAAFLDRSGSCVVSASPERFFKISDRSISASPIKGTRPRGSTKEDDQRLRNELLNSEKDRAENTMIVDLLRNDLGRVCEYGSVRVTQFCELEEHPTLFHLVSTIEGKLRRDVEFKDVLQALFPCGSITGAPKIRTMEIIEELEPTPRGLSMGAIGYFIPETGFEGLQSGFDISVAIRTMVVRDGMATFNVGGGITIDSDPRGEYDESLLKAKALLAALGNK
jgi:para-aminobenzoate synthetase component I